MNNQPIEQALDEDLRQSQAAMKRAAERARELAARTGTELVVIRGGAIEHLKPQATPKASSEPASAPASQEPGSPGVGNDQSGKHQAGRDEGTRGA